MSDWPTKEDVDSYDNAYRWSKIKEYSDLLFYNLTPIWVKSETAALYLRIILRLCGIHNVKIESLPEEFKKMRSELSMARNTISQIERKPMSIEKMTQELLPLLKELKPKVSRNGFGELPSEFERFGKFIFQKFVCLEIASFTDEALYQYIFWSEKCKAYFAIEIWSYDLDFEYCKVYPISKVKKVITVWQKK